MSEAMLTALMALAAELLLVVLVLLAISWFRARAARRRDQQAIDKLVKRVKAQRPEREKAIGQFLEQATGLSGAALGGAQEALLHAELILLHRFAGIYSDRDAAAVARIDEDLVAALKPYHELQIASEWADVGEQAPAACDDAELETLRKENERLSDQLQAGMETMSRVLNDYSTMFDGSASGSAKPVAGAADSEQGASAVAGTATFGAGQAVASDSPEGVGADAPIGPTDANENSTDADANPIQSAERDPAQPPTDEEPVQPSAAAESEPTADDTGDGVSNDTSPSSADTSGDEMSEIQSELSAERLGLDSDDIEVLSGDEQEAVAGEEASDQVGDQAEAMAELAAAEGLEDVEVEADAVPEPDAVAEDPDTSTAVKQTQTGG